MVSRREAPPHPRRRHWARGPLLDAVQSRRTEAVAAAGQQVEPGQRSGLPDGKWLAYATDESGAWNIYVTTFPGAVGKWQVSTGGGTEPRWRGDAKEIFYLAAENVVTAVSVQAGSTFSSGTPQALFRAHPRPPISNTDVFSYDVTKDGSRFIVNRYLKPAPLPPPTSF